MVNPARHPEAGGRIPDRRLLASSKCLSATDVDRHATDRDRIFAATGFDDFVILSCRRQAVDTDAATAARRHAGTVKAAGPAGIGQLCKSAIPPSAENV